MVSASSQLHEAQRLRSAHTHAKSHSHWDGWTFSDLQKTWRFFRSKRGWAKWARQLSEDIWDPAVSHPAGDQQKSLSDVPLANSGPQLQLCNQRL